MQSHSKNDSRIEGYSTDDDRERDMEEGEPTENRSSTVYWQ